MVLVDNRRVINCTCLIGACHAESSKPKAAESVKAREFGVKLARKKRQFRRFGR